MCWNLIKIWSAVLTAPKSRVILTIYSHYTLGNYVHIYILSEQKLLKYWRDLENVRHLTKIGQRYQKCRQLILPATLRQKMCPVPARLTGRRIGEAECILRGRTQLLYQYNDAALQSTWLVLLSCPLSLFLSIRVYLQQIVLHYINWEKNKWCHNTNTFAVVTAVIKLKLQVKVGLPTAISVGLPPPTRIQPKSLLTLTRSVTESHAVKVEQTRNSDYPLHSREDTPLRVQEPQERHPLRYIHPQVSMKQLYSDVGSVSHITDAHLWMNLCQVSWNRPNILPQVVGKVVIGQPRSQQDYCDAGAWVNPVLEAKAKTYQPLLCICPSYRCRYWKDLWTSRRKDLVLVTRRIGGWLME